MPALVIMVGGDWGREVEELTDEQNKAHAMSVLTLLFGKAGRPLPQPKHVVVTVSVSNPIFAYRFFIVTNMCSVPWCIALGS